MLPVDLQKAIAKLPPEPRELLNLVILIYEEEHKKLSSRLAELEAKVSQNSQNSDKPPSSDPPYAKASGQRKRGKPTRRSGGQPGHKGSTLPFSASPDEVQIHRVERCSSCGEALSGSSVLDYQVRQVYDIAPIVIKVVEHRSEVKSCSCCGAAVVGAFPPEATGRVQYGSNLRSLVSYFHNYQMIPYARLVEIMGDLTGHRISEGTVYNYQNKAYERLEGFEQALKAVLLNSAVAGFDETGVGLGGSLNWTHVCTTRLHAHFSVHAKRGKEGMAAGGILPGFEGVAVHDFWQSYFHFHCQHAACNAHILRELKAIAEQTKQNWATQMGQLLRQMNRLVKKHRNEGKEQVPRLWQRRLQNRYDQLLRKGLEANPPPEKGKNSKARNLLIRLRDWESAILAFFYDFEIPFTNNEAERDLRMLKVKLKISGCFRGKDAAVFFMRIRSYILTARKQGNTAFQALKALFDRTLSWDHNLILNFRPLPTE